MTHQPHLRTFLQNNNNNNNNNKAANASGPFRPTKHYISPEQVRMQTCIDSNNVVDYFELFSVIKSIEMVKAPDRKNSRLLMRVDAEDDATVLLAQRRSDELRYIVDNTLPQYIRGPNTGRMREIGNKLNDGYEPIIYATYIVDRNGNGFTIDELLKLLEMIEVVVGRAPDNDNGQGDEECDSGTEDGSADEAEDDDADKVNFFRPRSPTTGNLRTIPDSEEEDDDYLDANDAQAANAAARREILRMFNATYQGRTGQSRKRIPKVFWDSVDEKARGRCERRGRAFVKHYREVVIPSARKQGATHIMIPAEVGLSSKGWKRIQAHNKLDGKSPSLFRLIQVAAYSQFGGKFSLLPVYVLDLSQASQAEIGESICSVLCGAYGRCGGLNFAQPGISKTQITAMNESDWKTVVYRNVQAGRYRYTEGNLKAYIGEINETKRMADDQIAGITRGVEYQRIQQRFGEAMVQLDVINEGLHRPLLGLESDIRALKTAVGRRQKRKVEVKAIDAIADSLDDMVPSRESLP